MLLEAEKSKAQAVAEREREGKDCTTLTDFQGFSDVCVRLVGESYQSIFSVLRVDCTFLICEAAFVCLLQRKFEASSTCVCVGLLERESKRYESVSACVITVANCTICLLALDRLQSPFFLEANISIVE